MSVYPLLQGQTATNTVPPANKIVNPVLAPGNPTQLQSFSATITTTSGSGTATVQPVASNDGVNWSNIGSTMSLTTATPMGANVTNQTCFAYYGALVTAISGTGAAVTCLMSA